MAQQCPEATCQTGGGGRPPLEVTGSEGKGELWSCPASRPLPRHSRVNWSHHKWIEGSVSHRVQGCVLGRAGPGPALAFPLCPGQAPAVLAWRLLPEPLERRGPLAGRRDTHLCTQESRWSAVTS